MSTFAEPFLRFSPIYQPRVWGGRMLETHYGRALPEAGVPYGESWEISAREEADSRVSSGPLAGRTLREVWADPRRKREIFGEEAPQGERFPLLCKILDARDRLSIQVHPPDGLAEQLGGEPKTEVWYIAHAEAGAELYVGLKAGVTAESFRAALEAGTAERLVHSIPVEAGQHIFIPSGRLHAIGAGLLLYEIQQNSDTTYRVYDWNRTGLDGKPRALHVAESLQCIDFGDVEPEMDEADGNLLCECGHFRLEEHALADGKSISEVLAGRFALLTVAEGTLRAGEEVFREGDFFLVPKGAAKGLPLAADSGATVLLTTWPA